MIEHLLLITCCTSIEGDESYELNSLNRAKVITRLLLSDKQSVVNVVGSPTVILGGHNVLKNLDSK